MSANKNVFSLLAKLSSLDAASGESEAEKKLAELRKIIDERLLPVIDGSMYTGKSSLKMSIDAILDDTLLLCRNPSMIGKTVVGVLYDSSSAGKKFVSELAEGMNSWLLLYALTNKLTKPWGEQSELPGILTAQAGDDSSISLTDRLGRESPLSPDEYRAMMGLKKDGIALRDVASNASYSANLRRDKSVYILLPVDAYKDEEIYIKFAASCDVTVFAGNIRKADAASFPQAETPLYISYGKNNDADARNLIYRLKETSPNRVVETVPFAELPKVLDEWDGCCQNITLADRLNAELLLFLEAASDECAADSALAEALARDSVFMKSNDDETKEKLEKMRSSVTERRDKREELCRRFGFAMNDVLETARELEDILGKLAPHMDDEKPERIHAGAMQAHSLWRRIALRFIKAGDIASARSYCMKLGKLYPDEAFIVSLYCTEAEGRDISGDDTERLRWLPDSASVLRAKIHFRSALGITTEDCVNIAELLSEHRDADELFFHALSLKRRDEKLFSRLTDDKADEVRLSSETTEAFRRAAEAGSAEAADFMADCYFAQNDFSEMRTLADIGNAKAAWNFSCMCVSLNKNKYVRQYRALAAALGSEDAVRDLAGEEWRNAVNDIRFQCASGKYDGAEQEAVARALMIYERIAESGMETDDDAERLGMLYFLKENWPKAREILDGIQHKTPNVFFMRAVMLYHGRGCNKDMPKAELMINKVVNTASDISKTAEQVRDHWRALAEKKRKEEEEKRKKEYDENRSYSRSSSSSSSSSSPCFITSATCRAEGRPDDCAELTAFRRFRDEVLLSTPRGAKLVDTYYKIAPGIVERIEADPERESLYSRIFEQYISPGYEMLTQGRGESAMSLYTELVRRLAARYGIDMGDEAVLNFSEI